MSRSSLPQSDADRIAAAATAFAIAAIVWVVLAAFPDPRDVPIVPAHGMTARHVDEGSRASPRNAAASTMPKASAGAGVQSRAVM